jgi:hypothetical protein
MFFSYSILVSIFELFYPVGFPLKYPRVLKLIRGCIGSSGNVRVGRLAIGQKLETKIFVSRLGIRQLEN